MLISAGRMLLYSSMLNLLLFSCLMRLFLCIRRDRCRVTLCSMRLLIRRLSRLPTFPKLLRLTYSTVILLLARCICVTLWRTALNRSTCDLVLASELKVVSLAPVCLICDRP